MCVFGGGGGARMGQWWEEERHELEESFTIMTAPSVSPGWPTVRPSLS